MAKRFSSSSPPISPGSPCNAFRGRKPAALSSWRRRSCRHYRWTECWHL
uniref:Uncharacterized protein n=1 Tax=Rhizophora mucronata TaxID=61149 RepID=A0A2P2QGL6_RHIMU